MDELNLPQQAGSRRGSGNAEQIDRAGFDGREYGGVWKVGPEKRTFQPFASIILAKRSRQFDALPPRRR